MYCKISTFLIQKHAAGGGYRANNLYSTVYIGPSSVYVGHPFSITCTVSISESIQWMKDGELIEKYSKLLGRHHVKEENSYVLTESDIEGIIYNFFPRRKKRYKEE